MRTTPSTVLRHAVTRTTVAVATGAALLAAAVAYAPAAHAAPSALGGVELPQGVLPVWLVSDEYEVSPRGEEQLVATVYELVQHLEPGVEVADHFERLARRGGWSGGLTRTPGAVEGHWQTGDLTVDVRVSGPASARRLALTIRVTA